MDRRRSPGSRSAADCKAQVAAAAAASSLLHLPHNVAPPPAPAPGLAALLLPAVGDGPAGSSTASRAALTATTPPSTPAGPLAAATPAGLHPWEQQQEDQCDRPTTAGPRRTRCSAPTTAKATATAKRGTIATTTYWAEEQEEQEEQARATAPAAPTAAARSPTAVRAASSHNRQAVQVQGYARRTPASHRAAVCVATAGRAASLPAPHHHDHAATAAGVAGAGPRAPSLLLQGGTAYVPPFTLESLVEDDAPMDLAATWPPMSCPGAAAAAAAAAAAGDACAIGSGVADGAALPSAGAMAVAAEAATSSPATAAMSHADTSSSAAVQPSGPSGSNPRAHGVGPTSFRAWGAGGDPVACDSLTRPLLALASSCSTAAEDEVTAGSTTASAAGTAAGSTPLPPNAAGAAASGRARRPSLQLGPKLLALFSLGGHSHSDSHQNNHHNYHRPQPSGASASHGGAAPSASMLTSPTGVTSLSAGGAAPASSGAPAATTPVTSTSPAAAATAPSSRMHSAWERMSRPSRASAASARDAGDGAGLYYAWGMEEGMCCEEGAAESEGAHAAAGQKIRKALCMAP